MCGTPVEIAQVQQVTPIAGSASETERGPADLMEPDEETQVVARSPGGTEALRQFAISKQLQFGLLAGAAAVLLAVGAFVVYYFWYGNSAIEKKLDAAITRGELFKPEGESAYDLYHQLKKNGVDDKTLTPFENRLLPQLTTQPLKLISDFAVPTNAEPVLSDWQTSLKLIQWAVEMRPDDNPLNAREKYIEGRIAFISNQKDQALDLWKKASDLDRTWAIPPNGIGVIYNEKKSFETARKYLFEAIRREASWAVPYNSIGTSYFFEKKYDDAWTYYMKAVERSPNWARPHAWLGDVAMRREDFVTAADEYQKALDLAQSGNTSLDLNDIKRRLDQAKKKSQEVGEGETIERDS
jgi:Flp pilus assembly protein TadD